MKSKVASVEVITFILVKNPTSAPLGVFGWKVGDNCKSIEQGTYGGKFCLIVENNEGATIREFEPVHVVTIKPSMEIQ